MGEQPSKFLQHLSWGGRVLRAYARIGWVRKSQFRLEFFNQVLMDSLFYLASIATFTMLYALGSDSASGTVSLAGWSYAEMKVFLGMTFVADALMMTFQGQQWHFGNDLKNGALDPFRVRPGPTAFLYFYQRFSPEGLTNLLIASGWLAYALSGVVGGQVSPWRVAWALPCALVLIAWTQVFIGLFYSLVELWLLNSDLGHLASQLFNSMAERPIDVYPTAMARGLLYVVPVAAVSWFPSSLVLGRLSPGFALAYPLVLAVFAWVVARIFRLGLRRYDSAMG